MARTSEFIMTPDIWQQTVSTQCLHNRGRPYMVICRSQEESALALVCLGAKEEASSSVVSMTEGAMLHPEYIERAIQCM